MTRRARTATDAGSSLDGDGGTPGTPVVGVILAGGRSARMGGGDKCLLPVAGRPLLAHVTERLAPQVAALVLSANGDPARFAPFGLPVVADPIGDHAGPLAGILAGFSWTRANRAGHEWIVTVAADTPFLPPNLVLRLSAGVGDGALIVLAESRGRIHPTIGLWSLALADDLETWLAASADRAVRRWVDRRSWTSIHFDDDENGVDPFLNINTPQDLDALRRRS